MNKFYLSCWECACTFLLGLVKTKSIIHLQNVPNSVIDCQILWVLWNCQFYFFSVVCCVFFHKYVSIKLLFFGRSWIMASVSPSIFVNWLLVKMYLSAAFSGWYFRHQSPPSLEGHSGRLIYWLTMPKFDHLLKKVTVKL